MNKIQLQHQIKPADRPIFAGLASEMLNCIDNDPNYLNKIIIFSNEANFYINGYVN